MLLTLKFWYHQTKDKIYFYCSTLLPAIIPICAPRLVVRESLAYKLTKINYQATATELPIIFHPTISMKKESFCLNLGAFTMGLWSKKWIRPAVPHFFVPIPITAGNCFFSFLHETAVIAYFNTSLIF